MHELSLDAHAAQDAVALAQPDPEPRAPGEVSSALVATRKGGGGPADERGLADDATLLRAMQAAPSPSPSPSPSPAPSPKA